MKEVDLKEKDITAVKDRVFKEIFYDERNKDLLIAVVETCLGVKISNVEYKNNELPQGNYQIRGKRLDILLDTDKGKINVELNAKKDKYINARNFSYICNVYIRNTLVGDDYTEDVDIIQINLTFGLGKESKEIFEEYVVMSKHSQKMYIKNLTIYEFNMDKIMEFWYSKDEEKIKRYKYLIMLGLTSKELDELVGDDKRVEDYKKKYDEVTITIGINDWIDEETDQRMIRNTIAKEARKEGLAEGRAEGHAEGHVEGLAEGIKETQRNFILNMYESNMSIEDIAKISKMPIDEIKNIINIQ